MKIKYTESIITACIVLLSLLLSIYGCTSAQKDLTDIYSLKKQQTYYLPIDEKTPVLTTSISFCDNNNKPYMYILNTEMQRIQTYDWNTKKLIKTIQLDKEGPNGVGMATSIQADNVDSIFVLSSYYYKLFHLNKEGQILNRYSLLDESVKFDSVKLQRPIEKTSVLTTGNSENPIFKYNNLVIVGAYPNLDASKEIFFKEGNSGLILDTKTRKIGNIMHYPENYLNDYLNGYRFPSQLTWSSLALNKDKNVAVLSFPIDENLYITDLGTKKTHTNTARSKYIEEVEVPTKTIVDPNKEFDYYIKTPNYGAIYYDPFRKIYLRYAKQPNPEKKDEYDNHAWFLISVILLDEHFNRIGETLLEEHTPAGTIFFRKNGIYIQKYSRDLEDKLTFVRYELSKN